MPTLIPLQIPPGAWRNGTEYQSKGRWHDMNLVRWRNGAMFPVGGWTQYQTGTFTGIARGCIAWADNSANRWAAWGTADYAYAMDDDGGITDITPAGLTAGSVDASTAGGYGALLYGDGTYGTPRPDTGSITLATSWSWDTFGQLPVACDDSDGRLWEWDLNTANNLTAITNAPTMCDGLVVTQERIIFALGAGGDPRRIEWCDREARTSWTASATNQAGGFDLKTDGEIMLGIKARSETLILTSVDAWQAQYVGYPDVYSFSRVGSGCGAPGRRVAIKVDGKVLWLGHNGFFSYEAGYVRRLPCDVWDFFQEDLSTLQASKVYGWLNHQHDEAWWCYPSDSSNECDSYIAFNYVEGTWSFGHMPVSSMIQQGVFSTPLGLHTDTKVYQHENGYEHGSEAPFCESGPFEIAVGDRRAHAVRLIPDESTLGDVTATFKTREYPTATETSHGPYTLTEPTSVRFSGRQLVLRVDPSGSSDWRWGVPRLELARGGRR
jgi:hypothetical protein